MPLPSRDALCPWPQLPCLSPSPAPTANPIPALPSGPAPAPPPGSLTGPPQLSLTLPPSNCNRASIRYHKIMLCRSWGSWFFPTRLVPCQGPSHEKRYMGAFCEKPRTQLTPANRRAHSLKGGQRWALRQAGHRGNYPRDTVLGPQALQTGTQRTPCSNRQGTRWTPLLRGFSYDSSVAWRREAKAGQSHTSILSSTANWLQ